MTPLIYKILFLILFFVIFFFILNNSIKSRRFKKAFIIVSLLLLGFLIAFYIRKIVYSKVIFASYDEANYLLLCYRVLNNKQAVVSGPAYVFILLLLRYLSKIDFLDLIPLISTIITSISLIVLYFNYKIELKNSKISFISCLILICSTYFLWPIIEGRPQQIGMLLLLPCALFYYKFQKEDKQLLPFLITYSLIFIIHIFSFFIVSSMIILLSYYNFLKYKKTKKFLFSLGIFLIFLFLFTQHWFIYSEMSRGILVLFKNYPLCWLNLKSVLILTIFLSGLFITLLTLIFLKIDLTSKINSILEKKQTIILISIFVILSLIIQFKLEENIHMSLYKNSLFYFGLFELGNILFGILFLLGLRKQIIKHEVENPFFEYSVILMIIGLLMIVVSLFFPAGFNNGLIRIINYWTLFAAPIITPLFLEKKYQNILIIALSAGAAISLIATSKDPQFFNYEFFWDESDFEAIKWLCSQNGTYLINNTQNSYNLLSKEESYYKLKEIIELKDKINCTAKMFLNIEDYSLKNPIYSKDAINIYYLNSSKINITNISEKEIENKRITKCPNF